MLIMNLYLDQKQIRRKEKVDGLLYYKNQKEKRSLETIKTQKSKNQEKQK